MTRATVNYRGSIHEKNGYLYLVFRYVHPVTKKDSTKWNSLKLKAGATKTALWSSTKPILDTWSIVL